jgi:hypothetical protein
MNQEWKNKLQKKGKSEEKSAVEKKLMRRLAYLSLYYPS